MGRAHPELKENRLPVVDASRMTLDMPFKFDAFKAQVELQMALTPLNRPLVLDRELLN